MFHKFTVFKFTQVLIILIIGTQLLACGGGGADSPPTASDTTSQLSGSIGDGPIVGATVTVKDKKGKIINTASSDASANYNVTVKIGKGKYPLIIEATGGTDLVTGRAPDFMLSSVLFQQNADNAESTLNINPFTTLIYQTASAMPGGVSEKNVNTARQHIFNATGFGLDPNTIADPATTPVTAANVAMIVKSSEALAEMFRRTHEIIRARDSSVDIEDVIAALAADLSDGIIDGQGAAGTQARISATATIVSAQVLIESLGDNLKVDGSKATASLNYAIVSTRPAATVTTVPNNAAALAQARTAVAAASAIAPSIALSTIASVLESVQPGTSPEAFSAVLPADTSFDLNNAINIISVATDSQIDLVNKTVRDPSSTPPQNSGPVISGTPATSVTENTVYSFQPVATDANGDKLTFSIVKKPAWASFSSSTGRLSGTPGNSHIGTTSGIVISVSDGSVSSSLSAFNLTVNGNGAPPANTPPVISGTPASSVIEDSAYNFQPSASDADSDTLTFSISNKPLWASFNSGNGRLSGTPGNGHVGVTSGVVISVTDGQATVALSAFSITVSNSNDAPVIAGSPATSVAVGGNYNFTPTASDTDGDKLTFSIRNKPVWASFNTGTGRLSGTPVDSYAGSHNNIVISVTDGTDSVSLQAFSIQVAAEGEFARVTANLVSLYPFTERSGNVVRDLSGSARPMDLTISGSVSWYGAGNGVVMNGGRVGTQGPATDLINALRASNASSFEIWVQPANITQTGPTRMISVGGDTSSQNFMLGQVSDDLEARLLHTGKQTMIDPGLSTNNGVLDTSLVHLVHTYDGSVERLYINGVQHSQTVAVAGGYGNWNVSDLFSIGNEGSANRPYNGIIRLVAVYDRSLITAEIQQNFAAGPAAGGVDGGGANYVPVISGSPAGTVINDESYDFQPTASDADSDTLVFSIDGKPAWANFDTVTGRLSGSPTLSDVGTYSNIVISVTDGTDTASLGTFSIQVSEYVQTGSFTLSWTAPVTRSDGTPLSLADINGYRLHYGTSPGIYTDVVDVNDGAAISATVTGVPLGTSYVVMTTYDVAGRESVYSREVSKVVQ